MSIADKGEVGKSLYAAQVMAGLGVPVFRCKLNSQGNPVGATGWHQSRAGDDSFKAIGSWREGDGLAAVMGQVFDVIDVDPRNGGTESWPLLLDAVADNPPEIFAIAATPSRGFHFYIRNQGVRKGKLFPGIDFQAGDAQGKGRGFVFIGPTLRPSKYEEDAGKLRPYTWLMPPDQQSTPWVLSQRAWDFAREDQDGSNGGRRSPEEHMRAVLAAGKGEQRDALCGLVQEYEWRGLSREEIRALMRDFLPSVRNFEKADPWLPSHGNPDRHINTLFHRGRVKADATAEEMAGIKDAQPKFADDEREEAFWKSRPVLEHIYAWARARRASPWATFGEVLAEVVCHTPPSLQLPPAVGGEGSLNLLIASVGRSGAGKGAAAKAARAAFKWTGILGSIGNHVDRVPIGSGEGLVKTFGFIKPAVKEKGIITEPSCLVRTRISAIITIAEIDTFTAIRDRSGSTISPELRKLYSGEMLGFQWSDPTKQVIIPEHGYRSCVIAGVQPRRGEAILNDIDGGFAQRWLFVPAEDRNMPDERPPEPECIWEWEPPDLVASLAHSDGPYIMKVFQGAINAIDRAHVATHRGESDDIETHRLYTQLKVAAGIALLDDSDIIRESDWELAGFVMAISDRTRKSVSSNLAQKQHDANIAAGKAEGVRREIAETTANRQSNTRIARNVLRHLDGKGIRSATYILDRIAYRDRKVLPDVLRDLIGIGKIEKSRIVYRNQKGIGYRRI